jgi:hypothetical protein
LDLTEKQSLQGFYSDIFDKHSQPEYEGVDMISATIYLGCTIRVHQVQTCIWGCLPLESLFGSFSFSGMSFSPDPGFLNYEYGDFSIVTRVI